MTITQNETATTALVPMAKAHQVRDALAATILSAHDSSMPVLSGVKLDVSGSSYVFTSTDRYRLTRVTVTLDEAGTDHTVIIPLEAAKRMLTALKGLGARPGRTPAWFVFEGDKVSLHYGFDGGVVAATGVTGEFPRVESITTGHVPADTQKIAFDPKFMADLCKMPGRERNLPVIMSLAGATKPMVATWGDQGDVEYLYVLMPVRMAD